VTSSVAEIKYNSAGSDDVMQQQANDVTSSRDRVLHWCYSKYLQVRPVRVFLYNIALKTFHGFNYRKKVKLHSRHIV